MTRLTHIGTVAIALAALGSACGPSIPPPKPLPPPPPPSAVEQAAAADDTPVVTYIYSPLGKRDPFRDLTTGATKIALPPTGAQRAANAPLQKFDVDQLRLQFTVTGTSSPVAVVLDPSGRAHNVKIGDFIGKNWGKVSNISREELTITETIADQQTGRVYPQYIPLRMPKTEDEKKAEGAFDMSPGRPL